MAAVTATENYYQYQKHSKIGGHCRRTNERNSRFEYKGIRTEIRDCRIK